MMKYTLLTIVIFFLNFFYYIELHGIFCLTSKNVKNLSLTSTRVN